MALASIPTRGATRPAPDSQYRPTPRPEGVLADSLDPADRDLLAQLPDVEVGPTGLVLSVQRDGIQTSRVPIDRATLESMLAAQREANLATLPPHLRDGRPQLPAADPDARQRHEAATGEVAKSFGAIRQTIAEIEAAQAELDASDKAAAANLAAARLNGEESAPAQVKVAGELVHRIEQERGVAALLTQRHAADCKAELGARRAQFGQRLRSTVQTADKLTEAIAKLEKQLVERRAELTAFSENVEPITRGLEFIDLMRARRVQAGIFRVIENDAELCWYPHLDAALESNTMPFDRVAVRDLLARLKQGAKPDRPSQFHYKLFPRSVVLYWDSETGELLGHDVHTTCKGYDPDSIANRTSEEGGTVGGYLSDWMVERICDLERTLGASTDEAQVKRYVARLTEFRGDEKPIELGSIA